MTSTSLTRQSLAQRGALRCWGRLCAVPLRRPRRVLVLGGARSGKSSYAEGLLARERAVDYVACGIPPGPDDPEWADRVALHRARRPASWRTVETLDLPAVLGRSGPPVLVDCLTTWLAGQMDACGVWAGEPGADDRLAAVVDELLAAWTGTPRRVVAVSNEVGNGIVPATPSGRRFRDELGVLNARVAGASTRVWLLTAGLPQRLR
ncbi:bifunctional adenosylcobinamide kinase/adenosylcobinamide-phosphate guanylyltransferase [Blastococcus sp. TML/M2B]|nr:bifunctional adenosylcobinamide kinase/adenosylcobinamide-phosphate guanylyltransferase [Blastococcus sp. TML/M2B]MBN1097686.1 bifunctional adenosylcobinamide kinase/adenosylcobinamide-phosphate guanylyltransferase [Blastococcus sp. TML/C7B]